MSNGRRWSSGENIDNIDPGGWNHSGVSDGHLALTSAYTIHLTAVEVNVSAQNLQGVELLPPLHYRLSKRSSMRWARRTAKRASGAEEARRRPEVTRA